MKYKTAFRLAVRAIGVYLFALGVTGAIRGAGFAADMLGLSGMSLSWSSCSMIAEAVAKMGIGAYLFFGGQWIVNHAIPSNRPYCPECGYELTGLPAGSKCPECGVALGKVRRMQ